LSVDMANVMKATNKTFNLGQRSLTYIFAPTDISYITI